MSRQYFGTDGVRGHVGKSPIVPEFGMRLGHAAGKVLRSQGVQRPTVLIGKDTRISGYMLEAALECGFIAAGCDVVLVGPLPTPGVAYLTRALRLDLGVVISASHNPFADNGIKLFGPDGYKLSDEVELAIEEMLEGDFTGRLAAPADLGRAKRVDGERARYVESAKRTLSRHISFEGLRVVVDCANGAAYKVAPEVLWELGAEVVALGVEPNGLNINRDCGSTSLAAITD